MTPPPRAGRAGFAVPSLAPRLTPAQSRAQEATVAILRRYADAAESYLAAHPERIDAGAHERLCPCGIREPDCLCPLRAGEVAP
jgi:hypothetical protein